MPGDLLRDDGGAALVEAALVLPILLLLVFGVLEISFYVWTSSLASKAVQLGVRRAVLSDAVAVGPGLDPAESATYWDGRSPGTPCFPAPDGTSACPRFSVTCGSLSACQCTGDACRFSFSAQRLTPILKAMQSVMPDLTAGNIEISYTTNGLGYVTRPVPVPVDVRVRLVDLSYKPLFLGDLLGSSVMLRASAELPSEGLLTR